MTKNTLPMKYGHTLKNAEKLEQTHITRNIVIINYIKWGGNFGKHNSRHHLPEDPVCLGSGGRCMGGFFGGFRGMATVLLDGRTLLSVSRNFEYIT